MMRLYKETIDLQLCKLVKNPYKCLIKLVNRVEIKKGFRDFATDEKSYPQLNSKNLNILYYGLYTSEHNIVMTLVDSL